VASIPEAAGRALLSDKLHSLRTALKRVSSESEAACMERNLLRKQVRDERDRRCSLSSKVVCLTDQLKSARGTVVRLEEANEKLAAKQPAALSLERECHGDDEESMTEHQSNDNDSVESSTLCHFPRFRRELQ
jgi:chromosome segregation ATPase